MQRLLVLDSSFSFDAIVSRGLQSSVTCRDLGGFFDHVYTVHPFSSLVTTSIKRWGFPVWHFLADRHTFIDGKVAFLPLPRTLDPLNFLLSQLSLFVVLFYLIKRDNISVIRAGDPLYTGLFSFLLSCLTGIPLVIRVGSNNDKHFEQTGKPVMPRMFFCRKIEKLVEQLVLSNANLVAGANKDNLDFALCNGATPERSTLFRYGNLLDPRHFSDPFSRKMPWEIFDYFNLSPKHFLLYIGRLEPIKRPDHPIYALHYARRQGFDVKLLVSGDGSMRFSLEQLSARLDVSDSVIFCGNQSQDWLVRMIPCAAVVLSPHTGRALSEASLGSAPIVAYDVDWQGELVRNYETGLLVPYDDILNFSKAVRILLSDKALAQRLGANARENAMHMLQPNELNQHEIAQYKKLLHLRN